MCSGWAFRETLLEIVGLADSGIDPMVLFFFCDFFRGLAPVGYVERLEPILVWRHWFGHSPRSGKQSNSPSGAEGATMARRVPFPRRRIPASIEHSMTLKLLCV